jgi:hypothetical protein
MARIRTREKKDKQEERDDEQREKEREAGEVVEEQEGRRKHVYRMFVQTQRQNATTEANMAHLNTHTNLRLR